MLIDHVNQRRSGRQAIDKLDFEQNYGAHAARRPSDIAELALFLCSDKAGFLTGENICVDGGMTRQMIYHAEHGWYFREERDQRL